MAILPTTAARRELEVFFDVEEIRKFREEMQDLLQRFREMQRTISECMERCEGRDLFSRVEALERALAEMKESSGRIANVAESHLGRIAGSEIEPAVPIGTFLRAKTDTYHVDGRFEEDRMWHFGWYTTEGQEQGACVIDPSDLLLEIWIEEEAPSELGILHAGERRERFRFDSPDTASFIKDFILETVGLRSLEEVLRIPEAERVV